MASTNGVTTADNLTTDHPGELAITQTKMTVCAGCGDSSLCAQTQPLKSKHLDLCRVGVIDIGFMGRGISSR